MMCGRSIRPTQHGRSGVAIEDLTLMESLDKVGSPVQPTGFLRAIILGFIAMQRVAYGHSGVRDRGGSGVDAAH